MVRYWIRAAGAASLVFGLSHLQAATLFWDGPNTNGNGNGSSAGGDGTWSTNVTSWDVGAEPRVAWDNASNATDTAAIGGVNGTASLGGDIQLGGLIFRDGGVNRSYAVEGGTLHFAPGSEIRAELTTGSLGGSTVRIASAITGSPAVGVGDNAYSLYFAPTNGTVTLGTCTVPFESGVWDKGYLHLAGTTSGNSVSNVIYQTNPNNQWGGIFKEGPGTWAVGDVDVGTVTLNDGHLIANGTIRYRYAGFNVNGGILHYNNPGVSYNGFRLNGGGLDNSSGSPITNSVHHPPITWGGDWMFVGSQGTNSDLYVGNGTVTLVGGDRAVNVSNALATLTVGGVVGDGTAVNGLSKRGAGTLKLTGANTYEGNTRVEAGTLSMTQPVLADSASVFLTNAATLNLDYVGTDSVLTVVFNGEIAAAGEWGGPASGAANTTNLLSGTGILTHRAGLAAEGTWYWDGPLTNGIGNAASDGDGGTWSTNSVNWDRGLVARDVWPNTTNDLAIFRTRAGTVDLQSDITLGEILIDGVDNYAIGSDPEPHALHFGGAASIVLDKVDATLRAGITGRPELHHYGGFRDTVYLDPDSVPMKLGTITIGEDTTSNPVLYLRGSTTSNSATEIVSPHWWTFLVKEDSGTWALGDVAIYQVILNSGALVVNGDWNVRSAFTFNAGTLKGTGSISKAVNVPAAVGTLAPGDPTGTLVLTNSNCTIAGTLAIHVDALQPPGWGTLVVDGDLDITGATLNVDVAAIPPQQHLVIATFDSLAGTFDTVNGLPPNWKVDYGFNGGTAIALNNPGLALMILVK